MLKEKKSSIEIEYNCILWDVFMSFDMIIKTEDDHDDAEFAAIQSYTCQPILVSVEDNLDFTGSESLGNDCSIHPSARSSSMNTDASYPSATPSSINQNILTDTCFPTSVPNTLKRNLWTLDD